ncbi:GNAT family N-acetyltransferase [Rathayibacter sp. YIM 133350]|uniref:GNAT family N-acetyltransferase n=1 Tax=Rathayibacter sp. YIM 133350 TaxID=3131992 RepID=UPI00307F52C5
MTQPRTLIDGLILRLVEPDDAPALAAAYSWNRDYLAPWEPVRPDFYFTAPYWQTEITRMRSLHRQGSVLPLVVMRGDTVAGRFTLTGIEYGPYQNSRLGYWVAQSEAGRGVATATVEAIVEIARDELGLHRIEASTLRHNERSQRVLLNAGFEHIGMSPKHLKIAGVWQDHELYHRILFDEE